MVCLELSSLTLALALALALTLTLTLPLTLALPLTQVCLELSSMCVSHIHMWHERHEGASPEAEGGGRGGGNTPPSSGRATTEGLSDQIEACALWLP